MPESRRSHLPPADPVEIRLQLDRRALTECLQAALEGVQTPVDWPPGRVALSESEAAHAIGVNRHTLRDLRLAGRLPHVRVGRRVHYLREDLLAALRALGNGEA